MAREQPIELFMPPNVLKAKVGAGGFDAGAAERGEKAIETLKDDFAEWLDQDVRRLDAARSRFGNGELPSSREGLLRAAHDLKGQAGTFDFPLIARVASSLCNLIQDLPGQKTMPKGLVDAHVDAIHAIHRGGIRDASDAVAMALAKELEARVAEVLS